MAIFYSLLFVSGTSLEEAREYGWVAERSVIGPCWQGWTYLKFSQVHGSRMGLMMAAVVAVGRKKERKKDTQHEEKRQREK